MRSTGTDIAARIAAAGLLLAVATLSGCGVRGSLVEPKGQAAAQVTAPANSGQGKPANATPKPHKPFVLDGLLR